MYIKARKIAKRNVNSVGAIEGEINKQLRNIKSQDKHVSVTILILFITLIGLTTPNFIVIAVYDFLLYLAPIYVPTIYFMFYIVINFYLLFPLLML